MQPSVNTRFVSLPPEHALSITSTVYPVMGRQSAYSYNPPGDQTTPLMFLESSRLSTYLSRQSPSLHGMPILRVHDVP